jgi:Mrp family chromosome partitioning ATPase
VPDAFPVLAHADGVLIVSALGHDSARHSADLRDVLIRSRTAVLGVVANRVRSRDPGAYEIEQRREPEAASAPLTDMPAAAPAREPIDAGRVSAGA